MTVTELNHFRSYLKSLKMGSSIGLSTKITIPEKRKSFAKGSKFLGRKR